jgi:hypothetical protein
MIAGNAGLPLGAINQGGKMNNKTNKINTLGIIYRDYVVNKIYYTQEENIIQWILRSKDTTLFDKIINKETRNGLNYGAYGLPYNDQNTKMTLQGYDYTTDMTTDPYKFSCTMQFTEEGDHLCWVFGPNANSSIGRNTGTSKRTLSKYAMSNYNIFKECIKTSFIAALDALNGKVDYVIMAGLSTGIYSPDEWK